MKALHQMCCDDEMTSEMNTINQLYNSYDCRIIKEVKSIEKLEQKLVRHRSARMFNLRCLQEKVIKNFKRKMIKKLNSS